MGVRTCKCCLCFYKVTKNIPGQDILTFRTPVHMNPSLLWKLLCHLIAICCISLFPKDFALFSRLEQHYNTSLGILALRLHLRSPRGTPKTCVICSRMCNSYCLHFAVCLCSKINSSS